MPRGAVNVGPLPAGMTIITGQCRSAVQAALLVRMPVGADAGFDRACYYRARSCVPDSFEIRHDTSPCGDIMRASAVMLAPER